MSAGLAHAGQFYTATATADTLIKTGSGRVRHIVITGESGCWTVRDGTDTSGTAIGTFAVPANTALHIEWPIQFETGLFVDATGTVTRISILYE